MTRTDERRPLTPPLGWPFQWRASVVTYADRQPRPLKLNRYPGQVIGVSIRLPDEHLLNASRPPQHKALSILWSKPARWWPKATS